MSIYQTDAGIAKTAKVRLSSTNATAIVTAGNDPVFIEYVRITVVDNATPTCLLDIYDGSAVLAYVRGLLALTAYQVTTDRDPIVLEPGESLRATASAADDIDVTALYTVQKPGG